MALTVTASAVLGACSTTSPSIGPSGGSAGGGVIPVAASINAWGSLLEQLGGSHVHATSIINNPDTDPHTYEPTPADARTIARAKLFVVNGIGYDSWAAKAVAADPDRGRAVIDVGELVGVAEGGNPHRWYAPDDVRRVADQITADLTKLDPPDAGYYRERREAFERTKLARFHQLVREIKSNYAGIPVGASESVFSPLSDALGLKLLTPPSFLTAISEGVDPSAADKAAIDDQISGRQIKVYVFNSQNSTPDVAAQVAAAKRAGIAVSTITETLSPAGASFQDWQTSQLDALAKALHGASSS
ncbi:MAG: zinc ABC transporter substrate-binding protein [Actinomycetota bacterium]